MSWIPETVHRLIMAGIKPDDARALRRIGITLDRWHEFECGDSNDYGSWAIDRDETESGDGLPYLVRHHYSHGKGPDRTTRTRIRDRERGAIKRLAAIMARYPGWRAYIQSDPRGTALYILRPEIVRPDEDLSTYYSVGIAAYK